VRTKATLPSIDNIRASQMRASAVHKSGGHSVATSQEDKYEQLIAERELLLEEFESACWDHENDVMKTSSTCTILLNDIDNRDQALERIRDGELHLLGSVLGTSGDAGDAGQGQSQLLSALSATLSTTLKHIVTPPSTHLPSYSPRGAVHLFLVRFFFFFFFFVHSAILRYWSPLPPIELLQYLTQYLQPLGALIKYKNKYPQK
jgi:hypothetical protein